MSATLWGNDAELIHLAWAELNNAAAGEIMDKTGLLKQFPPPNIRPMKKDMVVVGRAMTVPEADVFTDAFVKYGII